MSKFKTFQDIPIGTFWVADAGLLVKVGHRMVFVLPKANSKMERKIVNIEEDLPILDSFTPVDVDAVDANGRILFRTMELSNPGEDESNS